MKKGLLFAAVILGCASAFAGDAQKQDAPEVITIVLQAKAQELARALIQLKLEEVGLGFADSSVADKRLALIRAQQVALTEEMVKLATAPLDEELKEALKTMNASSPRVLELKGTSGNLGVSSALAFRCHFPPNLGQVFEIPSRNLAKNGAKILCGWHAQVSRGALKAKIAKYRTAVSGGVAKPAGGNSQPAQ